MDYYFFAQWLKLSKKFRKPFLKNHLKFLLFGNRYESKTPLKELFEKSSIIVAACKALCKKFETNRDIAKILIVP